MCRFIVILMMSKPGSTLEGEKEFFILKVLEDKLVIALKKKDSRALCERLLEKGVISREFQDKFSSLDHVHLKEELNVRYLVQHIYDAVKDNKLVYHSFVDVLTEVDEGVVSELNKELYQHELLGILDDRQTGTSEAFVGSKRPRASIGEVRLCESDVPLLTEMLADGAGKAEELGIALGLKEVQIKGCNNYKMGLCHVIQEWIRSSMESCTVNCLRAALKYVGLRNISFALESKIDHSKKQHLEYGTLQPKYRSGDITIARGKSALLGFQVTSLHPVQYEWRKNGLLLSDSSIYSGTTRSLLYINCADHNVEGQYECIVTDGEQQHTEQMHLSLCQTDSEFKNYFPNVYKVQKEVPENSWFPSSDKFINLAIISKRKTGKEEFAYTVLGDIDDTLENEDKVEYEEVFGQYESGSLLLVEGRPGSGKTTLMHKVSKDWALEKGILQGAEVVVLVPIRLLGLTNATTNLANLFKIYVHNENARVQILDHYEKLGGEGVCFIFDGLDEYEYTKDYNTIIMKLITKKVWPLAMIVVASCPIGTASLRNKGPENTKCIEILGFKADQISEYVFSYFKGNIEKAENLMLYLNSHFNVYRMCYLPQHAAMICFLYELEGYHIPPTETKIYESITKLALARSSITSQDTESLLALTGDIKKYFSNICQLAFDMIVQSKQVMTNFPLISFGSDKSSLGLVTIDSTAQIFGMKDLYAFLHLTFQEYLAAFYLSQLDSESEVSRKTKRLKVNLRMVWKFYSGIVQFDNDSLILKSIMSDSKTDMLYKVQCAFESQQQIACDKLLELSEEPNSLCFFKNHFIPTDFLAMSYVIETSRNPVTKLLFKKCSLDSEGVDLFLDKVSTGKLENIKYIGFNKKNFTVSEFKLFIKILCKIQHSIDTLDLQSVDIYRPCIVRLLQDLEFSNLRTLKTGHISSINKLPIASKLHYIEYNSSEVQDYKAYVHYVHLLTKYHCNAVHYNVHFEMLSYCCNPINLMPKTNIDLFQRCRKLILINCGITDETFSELMNIFNYFVNVETIHLDFNKLTFEDNVLPLCTSEMFKNLSYFSARCNSIQDSGAIALAKILGLASTKKLEILDLQGNPITEIRLKTFRKHKAGPKKVHLCVSNNANIAAQPTFEELCAIGFQSKKIETIEAAFKCLGYVQDLNLTEFINSDNEKGLHYLKHCSKLKRMKLRKYLAPQGVFALAEGLKSCTNLQELSIHFSNIGSDEVAALVQGLEHCINLQKLDLGSNNIHSNEAAALAGGLMSFTNLQTLNLDSNNILSDGAAAIAEGLKNCTNLQSLNLGFNNIGSDGVAVLVEGLKGCTNLQQLYLAFNNTGSDGAAALVEGLKSCTILQTLDLACNNIGSLGATALAKGLKSCTFLQTLHLDSNNIGSDGAAALAEGLKSCTTLQTLNLDSNNIGSDGAAALAEGLKSCTTLQTLDLDSNNIGSDGAAALAEGLKSCTTLQTLNLDSNNLGSDGAAALVQGLKGCTTIKSLYLGYNNIGSNGAAAIAEGLNSCTNLQTLHLESNNISSDGATMFVKFLKRCTHLQILDLDSNNIGSDGVAALAEGMMRCSDLHTLGLGFNSIGSDGAEVLSKGLKRCTNLKILDLNSNNIASDGASALAEALKGFDILHSLNLDYNKIGSDGAAALAEGLKSCTILETLHLGSNNIGSDGAVALADCLKGFIIIQTLDLGYNNIGLDGAAALAEDLKGCTNLQILNLGYNNIGSYGAVSLAEGLKWCTNLQTLDLGSNDIGSYGAAAIAEGLKRFTNLQTLDLGSNNIGSYGATVLAKGFKRCTNLQSLNLYSNGITLDGAAALAESLKRCTYLQTLDLGSNNIGPYGAVVLAEGLKRCTNLQTLNLDFNNICSNGAIDLAEGKDSIDLQNLNIGFNNIGAEALAKCMKSCTSLQSLDLYSNNINSDGAAALAAEALRRCTSLQTLDLGSNNIGSDGAAVLANSLKRCTNLQIIHLDSNNIGTEGAVALAEGLKGCIYLQNFNLGFNDIGSDGAAALAEGLKRCTDLQSLDLGSNYIGSYGAVVLAKYLKRCTNLEIIHLDSNNIGTEGAVALAEGLKRCTSLQTLDLGSNYIGSYGAVVLAKDLKRCTNLEIFHLDSNNIGTEGAVALAEGLKGCIYLQTFNLGFNDIGSDGAVALAEGLNGCTILQTLDLDSNKIGSNGAIALVKSLKGCTILQTLSLDSNNIGSDGAAALGEGLKGCTLLQSLDLGYNNIGSDGAAALAECLKGFTTLQTLHLDSNNIGSDGAAALGEGLKGCTILQSLDLGYNNIGSDGAAALAEGLKSCTNLQTLYLDFNKIGSDGAAALAEGLKTCTNLQTLHLDSNNIGSDGAAALGEGLKSCTNLQTLCLDFNKIGSDGAAALAEGLKTCTNLQTLHLDSNSISSDGTMALEGRNLQIQHLNQSLDVISLMKSKCCVVFKDIYENQEMMECEEKFGQIESDILVLQSGKTFTDGLLQDWISPKGMQNQLM